MYRNFTLIILLLLFFDPASGQILRYRLSLNTGAFLSEPGNAEVNHPLREELSHPGSQDFKPDFNPGVEFEIMAPVTTDFEVGIQTGYSHLSGYTPKAPLYNFFLSKYNPLPTTYIYPDKSLIFDTRIFNTLGTARWYFLPYTEDLSIFMKLFAGVAFIGTDFTFQEPVYRVQYNVGVLYARGTRSSDEPKRTEFDGGAGLGATYRISDRFDISFDATASFIHSDIVNGVPNFNYEEVESVMKRTNSPSIIAQASIGLIYSAIPDRRFNKNNFTRSRKISKKVFWKKKNSRPFSKRKKRK